MLFAAPASEATPLVAPTEDPGYLCIRSRATAERVTLTLIALGVMFKNGAVSSLQVEQPNFLKRGVRDAVSVWPGLGTAFYCVGKVSQIFVAYQLGNRWTTILSVFFTSVALLIILTGNIGATAFGVVLMQFAAAHIWGASVRTIAMWVDKGRVGTAIGIVMGFCGDLAQIIFNAIFSALIGAFPVGSWWGTYCPTVLMASLQLVLVLTMVLLLRGSAEDAGFPAPTELPTLKSTAQEGEEAKEDAGAVEAVAPQKEETEKVTAGSHPESCILLDDPLEGLSVLAAIRVFMGHGRIWLAMAASVCFTCLMSIQNFAVTFAVQEVGFTPSGATLILMFLGIGMVVADLIAGLGQDNLSRPWYYFVGGLVVLLGIASGVILVVFQVAGMKAALHGALEPLVLFIGLFVAFFFSVVITVFGVRFGGPSHASTLVGLLDAVGFLGGIPYQFGMGALANHGQWTSVILMAFVALMGAGVFVVWLFIADARLPPLPPRAAAAAAVK